MSLARKAADICIFYHGEISPTKYMLPLMDDIQIIYITLKLSLFFEFYRNYIDIFCGSRYWIYHVCEFYV